jgi:hypothetical protein
MNQLQKLIEWMEEEAKNIKSDNFGDIGRVTTLFQVIAKAKELQAEEFAFISKPFEGIQATEQCKWAVVHKNDTFESREDAEATKAGWLIDTTDYVTVKIIEP